MIALRQKFKSHAADHGDIGRLPALVLVTGILLLASALGMAGLNADPIWFDELSTITNIGTFDPPYGIIEVVDSVHAYAQNDVPLFFVLLSWWAGLVGWSQLALRYFPLLFGVLMIAFLYRLSADSLSKTAGILAAFLIGTNAFVLSYFHELRPYTLLMLLSVVHLWIYWRYNGFAGSARQLLLP